MILAIDIENKTTQFGLFTKYKLIETFSFANDRKQSSDEIRLMVKLILLDKSIDLSDIEDIIISSVVPDLRKLYYDASRSIIKKDPIIVGPGVKTGLNIKYESPKEVGADRIIRAVGASNLSQNDTIIISASPITTIDYINNQNQFLGGLILPGIDLFEDALHRQSAKLPQVEIKKFDKPIGNTTTSAIQAGIFHTYTNAIFAIVDDIIESYKLDYQNTSVIITGIHASLVEDPKRSYKNIPNLGLWGLKNIYDLNKK